jgi:hypothetical protein
MEATMNTIENQLHLSIHAYERAKERHIIPNWIHIRCANDFIVGLIAQSKDKKIIKYGNLNKIYVAGFKACVNTEYNSIITIMPHKKVAI